MHHDSHVDIPLSIEPLPAFRASAICLPICYDTVDFVFSHLFFFDQVTCLICNLYSILQSSRVLKWQLTVSIVEDTDSNQNRLGRLRGWIDSMSVMASTSRDEWREGRLILNADNRRPPKRSKAPKIRTQ